MLLSVAAGVKRAQKPPAVDVPCNGCTLCCNGEAIILNPEQGDRISAYHVQRWHGLWRLQLRPNGDCVYLGPSGCTIWKRRPAMCRVFDCRGLVRQIDRDPDGYAARVAQRGETPVVAKGRELIRLELEYQASRPKR